MAVMTLLEGCRMLMSTINSIDETQNQMNIVENSFYSSIQENQLVEYKTAESKVKFALDASIAFGAVFSLFLTLVGGSGLIYLLIYGAYYGYRLYMNIQKRTNDQILKVATIIMYFVSALVIVSMFLRSIVVGAIMVVLGGVSVLIAVAIKNKLLANENKKIQAQNMVIAEKNKQLTMQYKSLSEKFSEQWDRLEMQAGDWMPREYLNKDAMSFFIKCLAGRRADSVKELANLYAEELYKRREQEQRERHHQEQMEAIRREGELTREQAERHQKERLAKMDAINDSIFNVAYEIDNANYTLNNIYRRM